MQNELSPKSDTDRDEDRTESPKTASSVLRTPVDVYSFSLALLTVLAVIFALHWAKAVFIPLMVGVMISYALSPPVNLLQKWQRSDLAGVSLDRP